MTLTHILMWFKFAFCSEWMETINAKVVAIILMLFLIAMRVGFSKQSDAIFHQLWCLGELFDFQALNCVLKYKLILFVFTCFICDTQPSFWQHHRRNSGQTEKVRLYDYKSLAWTQYKNNKTERIRRSWWYFARRYAKYQVGTLCFHSLPNTSVRSNFSKQFRIVLWKIKIYRHSPTVYCISFSRTIASDNSVLIFMLFAHKSLDKFS